MNLDHELFQVSKLSEDQKNRSSPEIEVFFPKSREDHKKGPNIIQRSDADHSETRAGHLRRKYFTCDSFCAATIFKRLRWRLPRKYFSNFERNRASAI